MEANYSENNLPVNPTGKSGCSYLIVGTGGVGGSIAGFLALAGYDVTCIARGKQLELIRENGLKLKSTLKGNHIIPIQAYSQEEYSGKADVIFVCIKGYSIDDSLKELIEKAAHKDTLVLPILNVYGTGPRIQKMVKDITVLDGCIYIVGFISEPGEITQMGTIFRLVYGAHENQEALQARLEKIQSDLTDSGIRAVISDDINRDTFIKWSFISAMACTGAYYDALMGELQKPGKARDTFTGLSRESQEIGLKMGITFPEDLVAYNLKVIDKLDAESTASMQKDIAKGKESEINGLLFDVIRKAEELAIEVPVYREVAAKFEH